MAEGGHGRRKKTVPAFTLDNVMESLKGMERRWDLIGRWLSVPYYTIHHIMNQHSTDSDRLREVLLYALSLHPFSGWRMIIYALHGIVEDQLAAEIQDYAEPLTDESLTVANVVSVLSKMRRRWTEGGILADNLSTHLSVSWFERARSEISHQHRTLQDQHAALAQYLLYSLPGFSWATFAGALYYLEEGAALQEARRYINREEDVDHTLTIDNLLAALQSVTDWFRLGEWLDVLPSRLAAMSGMEDLIREWLKHHPAPSWKLVAWALYRTREVTEHNVLKQLYGTYITAPLIETKMNACRQAIKDKGSFDQTIMQGIFFGLPRSGKTSSKKRLVGKTPSRQQASTGVAEKVSRVEIEQTTVQSVSKFSWNEVSELNDETALVVDDIVNNQPETTITDVSTTSVTIERKELMQNPTGYKDNPIHILMEKSSRLKKHSDILLDQEQFKNTGNIKAIHATPSYLELLRKAIQKASLSTRQQRERRWTIYLSDVGGQPEFQESLPALVSGPSLYFLTFPLHKGLKERFKVEYQHTNGKSIVPFEMTSTMEEVLLQSLATIASTKSHTRLDGKAVNAKVLFIATHKDKIQSEQQLLEIDQQLQKAIEKTTAYTENMIVFQSEHQMVFAIDNTSSDESDIQQVRDAVERIGTSTDEYKISLPTTWMIFAITLRHFPERVLTIEKCIEIAKECGIDSRDELNNALYFLHHNVGVIRYFQDHLELQGFVIKEPQYIFDTLTEMMVCTFNFKDLGPYQHKEFVKKGIFPTSMLHKLSTESDVLTGDKFATLLEHHHIITPIEVDDNGKVVKYFAPAALAHAELPPDTQAKKIIPTLVVAFKSGFCPTGMFGSLVVQLLKVDKLSNFKWKLVQDKIYRNQISFMVGPYDSFRFSLTATCIQVDCISSLNVTGRVPLGEVCCDIRDCIVNSVQLITQKLNYNEKASCYLAFNCPEHEQSASCHLATINFHKGKACTLTCTDTDRVHPLQEKHLLWFNEEMKLPSTTESDECNSESGDIPTISELLSFKRSNGTSVNIAVEVSTGYSKFAAQLLNDDTGARLRNIERSKRENPEEINIEILREWLKGGERQPVTWSALAGVLEDINKGELAAQIKQVKSLN